MGACGGGVFEISSVAYELALPSSCSVAGVSWGDLVPLKIGKGWPMACRGLWEPWGSPCGCAWL